MRDKAKAGYTRQDGAPGVSISSMTDRPTYQLSYINAMAQLKSKMTYRYCKLRLSLGVICLRPLCRFSIQVEDNYPIPTRQTKISHFDPAENGKEGAKGEENLCQRRPRDKIHDGFL